MTYDDNWSKVRDMTGLPDISIQKRNLINIGINIVASALCIFVFKIPIVWLPLTFLVFDTLMMLPDIFMLRIAPHLRLDKRRNLAYLNKRNKKLERLIEKYKTKYNSPKSYIFFKREDFNDAIEIYKHELNANRQIIENIESEKKKQEEELAAQSDVYEQVNRSKFEQICSVITRIKQTKLTETLVSHDISTKEITEKSKRIKKLLEKKPEAVERSSSAFLIFGAELIKILDDIREMDPENQEEYVPKIKDLISEYENCLERTEEKILMDDEMRTSIDISVLLNELRNDRKKQ